MSKINKALDYNKLLVAQEGGKLLKKRLTFPLYISKKYDGNYVNIKVEDGQPTFITTTSERHTYSHADSGGDIFVGIPDGVYMAERVHGEGKLGARDKCNLRGSTDNRTSSGHGYRVHDVVSLEDYRRGVSTEPYSQRRQKLVTRFSLTSIAFELLVKDRHAMDTFARKWVRDGFEGAMLKSPHWVWEDTKSRKITMAKWKLRPTADLLCVGTTEGEGKYVGMIGALILEDSSGRTVQVGSGLSDIDRATDDKYIVGQVVEVEYERIADTYIQPTFIRVRHDKPIEEID